MKIGMNMLLWTNDIDDGLYPIIEQLKESGYDGIEIPVGDAEEMRYANLGKFCENIEMLCSAVTSLSSDANPGSPDPLIRANAVERLKRRINMAKHLHADILCGPYHSAASHFTGESPTKDERQYSAEVMRQCAEYAEDKGITLTLEAPNRFECYLYNTLDDMSSLIRAVDHPNLKMTFNSHHANIEEKNSSASIMKHTDLIAHVHISESDRGTPGTGQVHWDSIFHALHDITYDGWLTIEAYSRNNPALASTVNAWRDFQPTLEEVYLEGFEFVKTMWDKYEN